MDSLRRLLLFIVVILVFVGGYFLVHAVVHEGFIVNTFLDEWVPFIDFFVVFYAAYFPFLLVPVILYWRDERYGKVMVCFLVVLVVSFGLYLAFPSQVVKPEVSPDTVFSAIVLEIHQTDPPVNVLPSLHVSLTLLAFLFIFTKSRTLGWVSLPVAVLIILSTVFIKQHVILDVAGGILLGAGVFYFRGRLGRVFKFS